MAIGKPFALLIRKMPLAPDYWLAYDYTFFMHDGTCIQMHWYGHRRLWLHCFDNGTLEGEIHRVQGGLIAKLLKSVEEVVRGGQVRRVRTEGERIQTVTTTA